MFKIVRKDVTNLIKELDLPDGCNLDELSLLKYIGNLRDTRYTTLLIEHYYNHKTSTEILEAHMELYLENIWDAIQVAKKRLKEVIERDYIPMDEHTVGMYFDHDSIKHRSLYELGIRQNMTIKEVREILFKYEYRSSVPLDRFIKILQCFGHLLDYPEEMKNDPGYPYNLFVAYHGLSTFRSRMYLKERMRRIDVIEELDPIHGFKNFSRSVKEIEANYQILFSDGEWEVYKSVFMERRSQAETSERMNMDWKRVRSTVTRILKKMRDPELEDLWLLDNVIEMEKDDLTDKKVRS